MMHAYKMHQDILFTMKRWLLTFTNNSGRHWCWKFPGVLLLWLFSEACQTFTSVRVAFTKIAPSPLDKQTASCNLLHDWLMSLAMDLAALCDMWRLKWHQWMPFAWFCWRRSFCPPLRGYPPPSHPIRVVLALAMPVKKLSKMPGNLTIGIYPIVGE